MKLQVERWIRALTRERHMWWRCEVCERKTISVLKLCRGGGRIFVKVKEKVDEEEA
jgi:hypothetical protein